MYVQTMPGYLNERNKGKCRYCYGYPSDQIRISRLISSICERNGNSEENCGDRYMDIGNFANAPTDIGY